ncbi:BTAD domain-containing putative transcriptional regulator [Micromonospora maris]|uniref:AfsR/SARP family transcriptional regulator n=1 Tax=Micromonospora maris TaxID=1003110 RepID=UPI002E12C373|nr:NB-ARC domain-containing protein [Micromonospora maris]
MRIRLLGPVEVESANGPLDVGPRQRRAVLAALAVDAGTPVSIDTLTERVWGPAAPEAPRSALYAHVARLRRALAQVDDDSGTPISLSRHGDGYVLNVDRQQVDLHRLNQLIDTGRAGTQTSDVERIAALREAMELWRGDPLATLAGDWANRVRRSVASQLISLAGAWSNEELRLGNPEAVADRLARILGSYPLAEPLVALQMRALCSMGRTPEALQYYVDTRAQIVEQFGAEPGPELRNLHVAILRGELDEPYAVNVGPVAAPVRHVPRQLPADIARFSGRHDDLAPLLKLLNPAGTADSAPVVSIYGAAGVGKSALAIHAAHRLAGRYPDGQLYIDLRGTSVDAEPLTPVDALARLLRTLGVSSMSSDPEQVDEAAALFRSVVAGRRLLLVLDNAVDAAQVRPLLPSGAGCGTLVTSRQPLAGLGDVSQLRVGPLTVADAIALLSHWVGAERVAAEPEAATAIAEWCECLPLALRIVGARLVARPGWPLAELRDRLADERRRLDNLEFDGVGLRASMAGSYDRLSGSPDISERAIAEAFKLLGTSPMTELSRSTAARLLARSEAHTERILERLVDVQLLETSTPGSYRMGELLRLYARERFAGLPEK